ncbi:MAG: nucleoside triphosphate pyrophosphohydrolase [Acidimicrobiales bacterium]
MTPRVVVVGLGPGPEGLLTTEAVAAIDRIPVRFVRTARHPSAPAVPGGRSLDWVYEQAASLDDVYPSMVEALVEAAAEHGEVLYAVPGSPSVAERSVELLAADARVSVEVLAGLSFLDLVWARLGVDPLARGVRLVDGHRFAVEAAGQPGPLLVAQCDSKRVLSDIKLAIDFDAPAGDARSGSVDDSDAPWGDAGTGSVDGSDAPRGDAGTGSVDGSDARPAAPLTVTVLQRLGLPDEAVFTVEWADLDRAVEPDHLTSLWIPALASPVAAELVRFDELVHTLRHRCPWDREQTHHSLTRHLLEETYEVLEAIEGLGEDFEGADHLEEELGDVLFQVFFHATLAAEEGLFDLAGVARTIRLKLVHRHPHVFGDVEARTAGAVMRNWEEIKQAEEGRDSLMDGIPAHLPSLLYAHKAQRKAASVGFDWDSVAGAWPKIAEEAGELSAAVAGASGAGDHEVAEELGDLLFAVVNVARHLEVDPEAALRAATVKFRDRFMAVERLAAARGLELRRLDLSALDALWKEVKG